MAPSIREESNVKIFVLYLLENIRYPLDFFTINDVVMQTGYVTYLDFALAFGNMLEAGLVEEAGKNEKGEPVYGATQKGLLIAHELKSDILPSILDKALECALRYLDFRKRGVSMDCQTKKLPDGRYRVSVVMSEKGTVLLSTELTVDSLERAERMVANCNERPEAIYRGILALTAGNINYLFQ